MWTQITCLANDEQSIPQRSIANGGSGWWCRCHLNVTSHEIHKFRKYLHVSGGWGTDVAF
jgi:hypothetical protein